MNYEEWSKTAIPQYTCEFGKEGIRDIYKLPFGIKIHDEVILPRSIFKKQHKQTLVDYLFHKSDESWLKENWGATIDYDRYSEEGYGYPLFVGEDSCEKAYEFCFALSLKDKTTKNIK